MGFISFLCGEGPISPDLMPCMGECTTVVFISPTPPGADGRRTNGAHGSKMANMNGGGIRYFRSTSRSGAQILNRIGGIESHWCNLVIQLRQCVSALSICGKGPFCGERTRSNDRCQALVHGNRRPTRLPGYRPVRAVRPQRPVGDAQASKAILRTP